MKANHQPDLKGKLQRYLEANLARVLTQMDRDPDSATFGCFDRNYWHYKIRDFPSAILQQGVFTLEAIRCQQVTWATPANRIEAWCVGAVNALLRQVDRQGGVNEYYPFEHSYPAAAFGLYAVCRVLRDWQHSAPHLLVGIDSQALNRLVYHLAERTEEQASNQQAAGLAGLALATQLEFISLAAGKVEQHATRLFNAQHSEGWFNEYGGPDFGYLSVTLDGLSDYFDVTQDDRALLAVDRAVNFLAKLVGADGRLPSTLNSRNTDYVVPYGLVRAAARDSLAAWLVETLFQDINEIYHPIWATDDRYHCHYIFASLVRSLPHIEAMKPPQAPTWQPSTWLSGCGYWIYWPADQAWTAYAAARKGGLVRVHRRGLPPIPEYGWRIHQNGKAWTSNWWSAHWVVTKAETLAVHGPCQGTQFLTPTPAKHIALRLLAWILREKLVPLLKRVMIFRPGSADGPMFERTVQFSDQGVWIQDRIGACLGGIARPSPRQNLRHVASADSFSPEEWLPSLLGDSERSVEQAQVIQTIWKADS